uniref:Uncharacterized protein n=1 Tax=Erpetoichthys calabaricus TaxID=27687 RepID=A0A8C4SFW3_ERPCA
MSVSQPGDCGGHEGLKGQKCRATECSREHSRNSLRKSAERPIGTAWHRQRNPKKWPPTLDIMHPPPDSVNEKLCHKDMWVQFCNHLLDWMNPQGKAAHQTPMLRTLCHFAELVCNKNICTAPTPLVVSLYPIWDLEGQAQSSSVASRLFEVIQHKEAITWAQLSRMTPQPKAWHTVSDRQVCVGASAGDTGPILLLDELHCL